MAVPRSTFRLDRHAGAHQGGSHADPRLLGELHVTAARQDGIVKFLTGLICVVFSLGFASVAVLGLHYLLHRHEVKLWAFVIGVPGLLLCLAGSALMAWGVVKIVTGRGRG
jgi:hypothetical protein